ncbi:putative GH25 family protein [Pedobacter sp. AK017]|uniref:hypothetical protein n=1 Tax=Pedobacter sp. AK017 TaxID=2723073 RepID=UPI00161E6217|nr:hypothetical protein [Pedobacter sp. AK017]MBB5441134.1 putative GH25 family protein [Pedobacter sp. AK017]
MVIANLKSWALLMLMTIGVNSAFAHAFWLKTNPSGKKGQAHEVQVFYAEPAEKPELLDSKEMANVKNFSLWLLMPGKEKIKLQTTAATDHYKASFTPEQNGEYRIILQNDAMEVLEFPSGSLRIEFYASAAVQVGTEKAVPETGRFKLNVSTTATTAYKPVLITVEHQDIDLSKVTISIFNQAGWKLDTKVDTNGKAEFKALDKGTYFIEAVYKDKSPGTLNNKEYKSVYCAATTILDITK